MLQVLALPTFPPPSAHAPTPTFVRLGCGGSCRYIAIPVATAIARAVIGKGGDNIKKLRAATGANIDVELGGDGDAGRGGRDRDRQRRRPDVAVPSGEGLVTIRSEDPEKLEAGRAAVRAVAQM